MKLSKMKEERLHKAINIWFKEGHNWRLHHRHANVSIWKTQLLNMTRHLAEYFFKKVEEDYKKPFYVVRKKDWSILNRGNEYFWWTSSFRTKEEAIEHWRKRSQDEEFYIEEKYYKN